MLEKNTGEAAWWVENHWGSGRKPWGNIRTMGAKNHGGTDFFRKTMGACPYGPYGNHGGKNTLPSADNWWHMMSTRAGSELIAFYWVLSIQDSLG